MTEVVWPRKYCKASVRTDSEKIIIHSSVFNGPHHVTMGALQTATPSRTPKVYSADTADAGSPGSSTNGYRWTRVLRKLR
ncbi:hypothetical protein J6590_094355 [Homalodisca vitripennis]|nr:hypothetical protein J6590_094355 [Homalodisca vitripennis]